MNEDTEFELLSRWVVSGYEMHDFMRGKDIKIPVMKFPQDMTVEPLISCGGAVARFRLNGYSVYLDCFCQLGIMEYPYWEVFDGDDCHRFKMEKWQEMIDFVVSLGEKT